MAFVNNSLTEQKNTQVTEYESNGVRIQLDPQTVRNYLVSGNAGGVTNQEVTMFIALCQAQKLNPFIKEAYLIKYGNNPATLVTGKETFLKRAARNPYYIGKEAGIIVWDPNTNEVREREGTLRYPNETLVGGWARVYIKDRKPEYASVSFDEYAAKNKDGYLNAQWASKPATMIRKVALVQALREAFPEDYSGMYSPEEITEASEIVLDTPAVEIPQQQPVMQQAPPDQIPGQQSIEDAFYG